MNTTMKTFLIVLMILVFGCEEKAFNPVVPKAPDFSLTPMENEEAEQAALHLSGQLIAPVALYERIKSELGIIRSNWSDSIEFVNIKFESNWEPSKLYIGITREAYDSMLALNYHYWDSLNDYFRVSQIDLHLHYFSFSLTLTFEGRLNSLLLGPAYAGLPGFRYIYTTARIGDRPELWLYMNDDEIKCFFRNAYFDCESGCASSDIYYFTVKNDSAFFHGSVLSDGSSGETPPPWLDTALTARREYLTWYQWTADSTK